MKHINELGSILKANLGWRQQRIHCLVRLILALIKVRSVNLTEVACAFGGQAQAHSSYRRLQRFFSGFVFNLDEIAIFVFKLFFHNDSFYLTMDRTNWKWGKKNINILTLGVVYKGAAIPLLWTILNKQGNSNTEERIELVNRFIKLFGQSGIQGLLGDREFVGKRWFDYLLSHEIPFYIRIKQNNISTNAKGLETTIDALFYHLKANEQQLLPGRRKVFGHEVYLTGLRLVSGELLVVASNQSHESHTDRSTIEIYGLRWEIETLFSCLKGRGFNFEDTRLTELNRIDRLMGVLAIAFAWAHKVGDWRHESVKAIKLKKHGRLAMSYFRYGLDWIREALCGDRVNMKLMNKALKLITSKNRCLTDTAVGT